MCSEPEHLDLECCKSRLPTHIIVDFDSEFHESSRQEQLRVSVTAMKEHRHPVIDSNG